MAMPASSSGIRIYKYQDIWKRKPAPDKMVQTKAGSKNNPWLEHLRQCAAEYQRRKVAEPASSDKEQSAAAATGTPAEERHISRRVVGKKPEAKASAPPKAKAKPKAEAKPLTERTTRS